MGAVGEFVRESQWLLWLAAALVLGLLELTSLDFVFTMLVLGALAASGVALAGQGFPVQAIVFAVVTVVGLVLLRPPLKRWLDRSAPLAPTNTDAFVGRAATVLADVTDRAGQVDMGGDTWTARSGVPGAVFPRGTDVVVTAVRGATAVVGPAPARPGQPPVLPAEPA